MLGDVVAGGGVNEAHVGDLFQVDRHEPVARKGPKSEVREYRSRHAAAGRRRVADGGLRGGASRWSFESQTERIHSAVSST